MKINPTIQGATKHWRELLPNIRLVAGQAARAAFAAGHEAQGIDGDAVVDVTIQLATDAEVQLLNAEFRGKDKPTNVLSFPSGEWEALPSRRASPELSEANAPWEVQENRTGGMYLGDIILARETLEREAIEQEKTFEAHFTHLIVHGVLHLMGYDHEENGQAEDMEAIEISVLSSLAIANPYMLA